VPPRPAQVTAPAIPAPPEDAEELLAWAKVQGVSQRLDDLLFAVEGPPGSFLPGRFGEVLSYRQVLLEPPPPGEPAERGRRQASDARETARRYLHRMAILTAQHREQRRYLDQHGADPQDEVLLAFMARLRAELREVPAAERLLRPVGTYEPVDLKVAAAPVPMLRYLEWTLTGPRGPDAFVEQVVLLLLGWNEPNDSPLRWGRYLGERSTSDEVAADARARALAAMIDLLRDPRRQVEQHDLAQLLRLPAWQYALGRLDQSLAHLTAAQRDQPVRESGERIGFRVDALADGAFNVEPVIQKRQRSGVFSKGARLSWHHLTTSRALTLADQRVYQAYSERLVRDGNPWGGWLTPAQIFGILRALIDHPAVSLGGEREGAGRLDIRQGRLRLQFASAPDGGLAPVFELLGVTMLAGEVARGMRDGRHLMHLHRPEEANPQLLLSQLSPQAAAVVAALAVAPSRFPPEAHDALATRLESLQEAMDIDFPSRWTRTIAPAAARLVARIELLASGALKVRLLVRPVKLGPVFAPGEGPGLLLEGQGRDRHGARRDQQHERQAAHALCERLGLVAGEELEPWCWRVSEGDPALELVATLEELAAEVDVEWADDARLLAMGTVGRRNMRMKVADRRDWFAVEGGAEVQGEVVPLTMLFAAIREGRRYLRVGPRGFVRIEETLRAALAGAEGAFFEHRGGLEISAVGSDPLIGLVEARAQIQASAAFTALRRRIEEGAGEVPRLPAALDQALRPYQKAGVTWMARLAHWGAGAILADEMGLGKTIQTLALLLHRAPLGPALVVAPTSVVSNWVNEAARFAPELKVRLYRGSDRAGMLRDLGPGDLVITSYAIATLEAEALAGISFGSLVLDEAQAVKNAATDRARALRDLNAQWRLGLTGTPIENHLGELWSLLRVVSPGVLGSWEQFRARYAIPIEKFGDDVRRRGLAALLRPFILRRTKGEVARELPARTEILRLVRLSPEEQGLYEELRAATLKEVAEAKSNPDRDASHMRFVMLAALTRLRQLCCHPRLVYPATAAGSSKAKYLLELLTELREGGHKALVFSQFRSFLDLLAPRLVQHGLKVLVLDGTTPAEVRDRRIAEFQEGEVDAFLISLKAGGFGLNLTAADTVIHLDPWWNPAVEDQATARAHRMGQRKPVTAVRLVARGTIEEAVLGLHAAKRALAAGILEGGDAAAQLDTEELVELIRRGADPAVWRDGKELLGELGEPGEAGAAGINRRR
jgi:superfamily II DNA or RNA helicase